SALHSPPAAHLAAEPGVLALGVAPGLGLGLCDSGLERHLPANGRRKFPDADRLHGWQPVVELEREKGLHLLERALAHHPVEALLDATMQCRAVDVDEESRRRFDRSKWR